MGVKAFLNRIRSNLDGNVLVLSAAGIVAMVGGAGLGVDTVQWYLWKRQLQQAVDSGATAGALSLAHGDGYRTSALRELGRNSDSTLSVTVEGIANPPASGAFVGDNRAVEVIAFAQRTLPFSSLFLDVAPVVRVRSVATSFSEGEYCVIALANNGVGVNVTGNADVELGCGVAADSGGSPSIDLDGTSWMNSPYFNAVGAIDAASSSVPSGSGLYAYGLPVGDPLASRNLQVPPRLPAAAGCDHNSFTVNPNPHGPRQSIYPGTYCNGLTIRGDVRMEPGVYVIDRGSFNLNSQADVIGEGVTIILTGTNPSNVATVDIAGGAEVDLRAPTIDEDPYWHGVLFFQDPMGSSNMSTIAGGSELNLEGVVYMPNGDVRFTGNSGQSAECLMLIAYRVSFTGDSRLDNDCDSNLGIVNPSAMRVRVVE